MTCKRALLCVLPCLLIGCGTAKTLIGSDASVVRDLKKQRTYCESVPRVYSGVAFDLCDECHAQYRQWRARRVCADFLF